MMKIKKYNGWELAEEENGPLVKVADVPEVDQYNDLVETCNTQEKALQSIVSLWPDLGMCAELVPEWVGPNDGRMRADTLWYALNEARKVLGLPTYPKPEHWEKDTTDILEKS